MWPPQKKIEKSSSPESRNEQNFYLLSITTHCLSHCVTGLSSNDNSQDNYS